MSIRSGAWPDRWQHSGVLYTVSWKQRTGPFFLRTIMSFSRMLLMYNLNGIDREETKGYT